MTRLCPVARKPEPCRRFVEASGGRDGEISDAKLRQRLNPGVREKKQTSLTAQLEERVLNMTKSLEVIRETICDPKHPFPKVDNQPKKPLKHRYERRKIKEYLHWGDWATGEAT